jgi:hypothetical protein
MPARRSKSAAPTLNSTIAPTLEVPPGHPAWILVALACVASVVLSAGYRLFDTDLWQLLVVGKAIWTQHSIPMTDQWAWASYGDPQTTSSWGFRALIYPIWSAFGVFGLFVYRWLALLIACGILLATARRMGARGFTPFVVVALCALAYRLRAEVRPESLAAVLLAITLWILESRRSGHRDRSAWLPLVACVWANVHISWYLGFALIGVYAIDQVWRERRWPVRLMIVAAGCVVAALVNPFGLRALVQPFEFALVWRHQEMFRNVVELWPVNWAAHPTDGLPVVVVAWPLLLGWRWMRRGPDVAGILCCIGFTTMAVNSQRFLGFLVLVALPFVARDFSDWIANRRWPAWTRASWARGSLATVMCLGIGIPEWSRRDLPLGIDFDRSIVPIAAADFLEANGVRGRAFNHFHFGGYLAWRGWPDRDRLPFATTQPENMRPADRERYPRVFVDAAAWLALDRDARFDYVVLQREQDPGDRLLDVLDADSSWALVFSDDVAQVLVRRTTALNPVAERHGYRVMPAGVRRREALVPALAQDSLLRARATGELRRMADSSPWNSRALQLLGMMRMMDGAWDEAASALARALELAPDRPRLRELLGIVALEQGRPEPALRWLEAERARHPELAGIDARIQQARDSLGARRR